MADIPVTQSNGTTASDATLLARANHTGTQGIATVLAAATARFFGRFTVAAGPGEELTGTQATTLLDTFTSALNGLVPASGGGTVNFLRADGAFAAPPSGGPTVRRLAAAHTNSTVTPSTVTDGTTPWTHTVVAGTSYRFTVIANGQTAATTTGMKLGVAGAGGVAGTLAGSAYGSNGQASVATGLEASLYSIVSNAAGSFVLTTGVTVINSPHAIGLDMIFNCTTGGTLSIVFASEIAASAAQLNIGSTLLVQQL